MEILIKTMKQKLITKSVLKILAITVICMGFFYAETVIFNYPMFNKNSQHHLYLCLFTQLSN